MTLLPLTPCSKKDAQDGEPQDLLDWDDALSTPAPLEAPPSAAQPARRASGLAAPVSEAQWQAWLTAIADHDEAALAALYDASRSRVFGLVLRVVRQAALADEVVEETYFQVWRQAARFDPARGPALAWLLGMARSRAIDALRREARFQHDPLDADQGLELAADLPTSDELLAATRRHTELHRALLTLQAGPRQMVALAFFRGLSHEDIAIQTALPLGTVKSQIRRALLSLQQHLSEPLAASPRPPVGAGLPAAPWAPPPARR